VETSVFVPDGILLPACLREKRRIEIVSDSDLALQGADARQKLFLVCRRHDACDRLSAASDSDRLASLRTPKNLRKPGIGIFNRNVPADLQIVTENAGRNLEAREISVTVEKAKAVRKTTPPYAAGLSTPRRT
jgi:hypothetical protein